MMYSTQYVTNKKNLVPMFTIHHLISLYSYCCWMSCSALDHFGVSLYWLVQNMQPFQPLGPISWLKLTRLKLTKLTIKIQQEQQNPKQEYQKTTKICTN